MKNKTSQHLIVSKVVHDRILIIRGHKIILDSDLAELYGVATKRLNEQVKRNRDRFPEDFMFQLTAAEKEQVVANCDHLSQRLGYPSKHCHYGCLCPAQRYLGIPQKTCPQNSSTDGPAYTRNWLSCGLIYAHQPHVAFYAVPRTVDSVKVRGAVSEARQRL